MNTLWMLLRQVSWPEARHHAWRHLTAWLSVVLGVALAFSVHLINQSALGEFSAAVRQVNGQPDFELRAQRSGFDEQIYARVAAHPQVAVASPVVEIETYALDAQAQRVSLRVLGVDALVAAAVAPGLMPVPAAIAASPPPPSPSALPPASLSESTPAAAASAPASAATASEPQDRASPDGRAVLDPDALFLNPAAQRRLGVAPTLQLQSGAQTVPLQVRGSVNADGPPLAVMDIAGAQAAFGWLGRISRIDVRLRPGADRTTVLRELALPASIRAAAPDESAQRVSNLSRAYRVNLTVLALVALFTGGFLVFSILSLSVAKRLPQLALLGVLGLTARERQALVLVESALLGVAGSVAGLVLGTGLAALALRLLSGDLGGAYFPGVTPSLHFSVLAALVYGTLGVVAAIVGGWLPARMAQRIAPAQALKGLGDASSRSGAAWWGPALLLLGVLLTQAPPVAELPLAAYVSVACLLLGGIACVPAGVGLLLRWVKPPEQPLSLLAVERARHQRHTATIAVAGVVASLSLSVALTVMVASFRESVTQWLGTVLPADLYARTATSSAMADVVYLPPTLTTAAAALPGVLRAETQRVSQMQLDANRPAVALIARPLADPARALPLVGELVPAVPGVTSAYVSEAMVSLYGAAVGTRLALPLPAARGEPRTESVFVRGVWRDYARQHGAVMLDAADFQRLTGDDRANDLALWLQPGADEAALRQRISALAGASQGNATPLEFASVSEIRATSLRIFDRSFAVTYWLQAVAIAIGLFGIAASFSAQVLARKREFGLLAHLGLTRRQVLSVVAAEGAVWTAAGALLGLLLGLAVSVVLVKVVNPQSFHWTMDLLLPWGRLALLCAAVVAAGTLTAWVAARGAATRQMALAVKEDW
ncbi:MAG: ABC transporter permease [Methylibium sp. NZG]|nr:MAG: ABC transporter permease [Methylibium sp. NZG]